MQTTLTIDVSDEVAMRFHALPKETINHFATAVLPDWIESAEETDEAFVAELIAADEEAKRIGTIPLEEVIRQAQADNGPGFVERIRARLIAEGVDPAHIIGAKSGSAV